jgi:hypothetical protein
MDFVSTWPVENATYVYTDANVYIITLNVFDGRINSTDTVTITINPNAPPTAAIDDPSSLQTFSVNETILFNATSSSDPNSGTLQYFWDFGDGTNSSWINESTTTHHYLDYGTNPIPPLTYTIFLTVRDPAGLTDTESVTVFVNNFPPEAVATSNVTTAPTNQTISFDGSGSSDPESGSAITYLWDFDDGNTSIEENPIYQFVQDGDYNVTLTVSDGSAEDTDWINITITNRAPVIEDVTISPDPPKMNEDVTFNVSASDDDGEIVRYRWEFGDGFTYSENASDAPDGAFDGMTNHSYPLKMTYTATITVEDDDGDTDSTAILVDIANTPPEIIITSPSPDESVSDFVTIEGTASDPDGSVSEVEIRIDNEIWQPVTGSNSWSFTWDTSTYVNGQHTIYVRGYDSEDYTDPPASVKVNVSNSQSSITVTEFLNPSSVEERGNVTVSGNVLYNTGEPVVAANVNISVLNEPDYWETQTDSNGYYSTDIIAPSDAGPYWVEVNVRKSSFTANTNEKLIVQEPPAEADLEITSSDILFDNSNPFSGDTVQITVNVNNVGSVDANNVVINVYYGDPSTIGRKISPDGTKTESKVSGDGSEFVTFDWDTTNIVGQHDLYVVLDPSDSITEANEDNNQAFKTIVIKGRPDFSISEEDITFADEDHIIGDTISIFIALHNIGTEDETVTYDVYDGDPDIDGILIYSGEEELSIDENKVKTVIVQWTPETDGEHQIFVVLTPLRNNVEDPDDSNNIAYTSIIIKSADEDDGGIPIIIPLIVILVVIVIVILLFLSKRQKGPEPEKELPVASVVKSSSTVKAVPVEEEEEEKSTMMDGQGGVRL